MVVSDASYKKSQMTNRKITRYLWTVRFKSSFPNLLVGLCTSIIDSTTQSLELRSIRKHRWSTSDFIAQTIIFQFIEKVLYSTVVGTVSCQWPVVKLHPSKVINLFSIGFEKKTFYFRLSRFKVVFLKKSCFCIVSAQCYVNYSSAAGFAKRQEGSFVKFSHDISLL